MKRFKGKMYGKEAYFAVPECKDDYFVILGPAIKEAVSQFLEEHNVSEKVKRLNKANMKAKQKELAITFTEKALEVFNQLCSRFGSEYIATHEMTKAEYKNGLSMLRKLLEDPDLSGEDLNNTFRELVVCEGSSFLLVLHLSRALNQYFAFAKYNEIDRRRAGIIQARYIDTPALSIDEIANRFCITKRTTDTDIQKAKNDISILLFQPDSILST